MLELSSAEDLGIEPFTNSEDTTDPKGSMQLYSPSDFRVHAGIILVPAPCGDRRSAARQTDNCSKQTVRKLHTPT